MVLSTRVHQLEIKNQQLLAKNACCNAICSNPDFLQIEHVDRLSQAQGKSQLPTIIA